MRSEIRQLMQGLLNLIGDEFMERVRGLGTPLAQSLQDRALGDPSADRRKLLTSLKASVDTGWEDFVQTFDDTFRRTVAVQAGWAGEDDGELELGAPSLQLLGDDQVEWDLALAGALSRMKSAAGAALSEYEQRVKGALDGGRNSEEVVNPVSIEVAATALKAAIERLVANTAAQRALLAYLEPLLSSQMEPLFAAANEYLAGKGIEIPRLKPVASANRAAGGGGGVASGGGNQAGTGDLSSDVLSLLQRLVQTGGGGGGGGGGNFPGGSAGGAAGGGGPATGFGFGPGMIAVPAAMLESLERLQAIDLQSVEAGAAAVGASTASGSGGNVLRSLRQQDFARQLPPIEAATIDIVAMLFDFIFDDKLVPDVVKALVGRLQIPLLKVAMLDKSFFSNREHPARAVLDAISKVSIAAGKGLDHGDPVFERIRATVNRVLTEFEKDRDIFAKLVPEMQALLAEQEKLGGEIAEKTRGVAEQQELGEIADAKAEEAFERVLTQNLGDAVPASIRVFLTAHWTRVLKFAFMKGGIGGHPWSLAIQTLNDLLWSLTPKTGADERQRLVGMLPELLRRVNAYLDRVGVRAEEKAPFLDALVEIHSGAMKGVRRTRAGKTAPVEAVKPADDVALTPDVVSSKDLAPSVVVTRIVQESGVEVESMALAGKVLSSRPVRMSEVGSIERGDWVEFRQEDGTTLRGRLSWVSPQRGIMLFTNPQSSKAISISPEALAFQLRRGQATRLTDAAEPLVDRALGKAMNAMKAA